MKMTSNCCKKLAKLVVFWFLFNCWILYGVTVESNNFTPPLENSNKTRTFYDYNAHIIAYKDLLESKCYLEQMSNSLSKNDKRTLYVSDVQLTKHQIWRIAGSRITEFCRGHPTYLLQEHKVTYLADGDGNELYDDKRQSVKTKKLRIRRQTTTYFRGRLNRAQTQSQYLSYGRGGNGDGKAEADAGPDGTRAVVVGNNGMGQAQSQSGAGSCGDCFDQSQGISFGRPGTSPIEPNGYLPGSDRVAQTYQPSGILKPGGLSPSQYQIGQTLPQGQPSYLMPGQQIITEQLPSGQLQPGQLPSSQLQPGQLPSGQLQPGQLSSGQLQPGQLPSGQLQQGQLPSGQLQPGQLQPVQLPSDQLQPGQLVPGQRYPAGPVDQRYPSQYQPSIGQISTSHLPSGTVQDTGKIPVDHRISGYQPQVPPGQLPSGYLPSGQMPAKISTYLPSDYIQYQPGYPSQSQITPSQQQPSQIISGYQQTGQLPPSHALTSSFIRPEDKISPAYPSRPTGPDGRPGVSYPSTYPGKITAETLITIHGAGADAITPSGKYPGDFVTGTGVSGRYPDQASYPGGYVSTDTQIPSQLPATITSTGQQIATQPGTQIPGQIPSQLYPGSQIPGQYPESQIPGQYPGSQISGQYPGSQISGQYPASQIPGQYPGSRLPGQYPGSRLHGQYPGSQIPGQYPGSQLPGQYPGSQLPGQYPGSQIHTQYPGQYPGPEQISGQQIPGQYPGVYIPGSQVSGALMPSSQVTGAQIPGQYVAGQIDSQYPRGQTNGLDQSLRPSAQTDGQQYGAICAPGTECITSDSDSQAETSVQQTGNETQAAASAQGRYMGGTAQSQVSGVYSGGGSFSAQAGTIDGVRGAQTQVSGGKEGAQSSAQGKGGLGQSQSQVQLMSDSGATISGAQSSGWNHGTNTQVQAGEKGGMADAQANGPGSTSSQAQIGFSPQDEQDKVDDGPFKGGGSASAQSGAFSGQSQAQIQGKFNFGIKYSGAAQAGSGSKQASENSRNFNKFEPWNLRNISQITTRQNNSLKMSSVSPIPTLMKVHDITNNYKPKNNPTTSTSTTQEPQNDDYDYDEDYDTQTDANEEEPQNKNHVISQATKSQNQHIILGPLENIDAHVIQTQGDPDLPEGLILQPGQTIPGSPGYQIPPGYRGRVTSVAYGDRTLAYGKDSQAQSVTFTPGKGKIHYVTPKPGFTLTKSGFVPYTYQKSQKSYPNMFTVTKSESGSQNLLTGKKNPHVYYTQASTCGIFINSCVFSGAQKICVPKIKSNPDGTPMTC